MKKSIDYYLNIYYYLIIKEDTDGTFYAEYPELKGCMTVGESLEEVTQLIKDAKQAWIETALNNNIPIPLPK